MKKFKIGIPAWKTGENSVGATMAYVMLAERYGEVVFLMPNHTFNDSLDLLLLPGGVDIVPGNYGAIPSWFTQKPDLQKEHFDRIHLPKYIAAKTSIMGICRGMQSLGVAFGAKLIQHMNHETNKPDDPYKCVHRMKLDGNQFNTRLNFTENMDFGVNSRHHQAIREESLPNVMAVIGRHIEDNTVEMIAHRQLPIVGTQFHFEDIFDPKTIDMMDAIMFHLIELRTSILI